MPQVARFLGSLGVAYRQAGSQTKALSCHKEQLQLARDQKDRREEEKAGGGADRPVLNGIPLRMLLRELHAERPRDDRENDQPAGVDEDRDAEDAADEEAGSAIHGEFSGLG